MYCMRSTRIILCLLIFTLVLPETGYSSRLVTRVATVDGSSRSNNYDVARVVRDVANSQRTAQERRDGVRYSARRDLINNTSYTYRSSRASDSRDRRRDRRRRQTPTIGISAPRTASPGDEITLRWSSMRAQYCTASRDWSGEKETGIRRSEQVTFPNQASAQYNITCYNNSRSRTAQARVVRSGSPVTPPDTSNPAPDNTVSFEISIDAESSFVRRGDSTTINWEISPFPVGAICTLYGATNLPQQSTEASGSIDTDQLFAARRIQIDCTYNGTTYTQSVLVEVIPEFQEI